MAQKRIYVGRVSRSCERCGAAFTRKASQLKNPDHVFCSRDCYFGSDYFISRRVASNQARFAGRRDTRPCANCLKPVERPISQFNGRTYCTVACKRAHAIAAAPRQVNSRGYIKLFVGPGYPGADSAGKILEHRLVMQEVLGRPLLPEENVHHRNGVRSDNRPENLELWTRAQPPGQRVVDKLQWAREFIALYENKRIE